jgi:hypothetical protein
MSINYSELRPLLSRHGPDLRLPAVEQMAREARYHYLSEEEHYRQAGECERCCQASVRAMGECFANNDKNKRYKEFMMAIAFYACPITIGIKYGLCPGLGCCCAEICCCSIVSGCGSGCEQYIATQRALRINNLISTPKITAVVNASGELRRFVGNQNLNDPFLIVAGYSGAGRSATLELISGRDPLPTVEEVKTMSHMLV